MFNEQEKSILQKAIETYGVNAQIDVAIEELAELTKALVKDRRNCTFSKDDFCVLVKSRIAVDDGIADALIMLEQLQIIFSNEEKVEEIKRQKIQRLENRLQEHEMKNFDYEKITVKEYREAIEEMCSWHKFGCKGCLLVGKNCRNVLKESTIREVIEEVKKKKSIKG